ncbi:MAG: tetratricopeptide repeat protein [Synechococcales bacterium]|nr:tetratricopeptide repeat protein [Synechococcales bacterium]
MITLSQAIESAFQAFAQGQYDRAEWMANQALQQTPNDPVLLNLLGSVHYQRGNWQEALVHYLAATEVNPNDAEAFNNLGVTLIAIARWPEAIAVLQTAIKLDPAYAMAYFNLGNALQRCDRLAAAQAAYEDALQLNPQHAPIYSNLGHLHHTLGNSEAALRYFRQAVQCDPHSATAHLNLANVLQEKGNLEAALLQYEQAAQLQPQNPLILFNLGQLYQALGDPALAQTYYHLTLQLDSRHGAAHDALGMLLASQGQFQLAIAHLQQAIAFQPNSAKAYHHLGLLWRETNAPEGAIACFQQSLRLDPDLAEVSWDLAQTYLAIGQWQAGFAAMESRWQAPSYLVRQIPQHRKIPRWDGKQSLRGKTLLLWTEQLQPLLFLRFLPLLLQGLEKHLIKPELFPAGSNTKMARSKSSSAKQDIKIVLECDRAWFEFLAASLTIAPYVTQIIPKGNKLPTCDLQAPIASLPHLLYCSVLPPFMPIALPDSSIKNRINDTSNVVNSNRIGIIWSNRFSNHKLDLSCHSNANDTAKNSIPLTQLLAALPLGNWISLQPNLMDTERELLNQHQMEILPEPADGLAWALEWAKAIAPLRGLLTVDCELAHLAANLGKSVWLLLPFSCHWAWGSDLLENTQDHVSYHGESINNDSYQNEAEKNWYPQVYCLRQSQPGDWSAVLEAINHLPV